MSGPLAQAKAQMMQPAALVEQAGTSLAAPLNALAAARSAAAVPIEALAEARQRIAAVHDGLPSGAAQEIIAEINATIDRIQGGQARIGPPADDFVQSRGRAGALAQKIRERGQALGKAH